MLWKGLVAYVVLLPIMVLKGVPVVGSKIQLSDFVFLAPCVALWTSVRHGAFRLHWTPLMSALTFLIGVSALSALASGLGNTSVLEVVAFGYVACVYLVVVNAVRTWPQWLTLIDIWVATSSVVAVLGIIGVVLASGGIVTPFAVYYPYFYAIRKQPFWVATSTFLASPTPNMVYGYLHLGFFLTLGLLVSALRRTRRSWHLVALIMHLVAILFAYSRGWLALLVGGFVFLWQFRSRAIMALSHVVFLLLLLAAVSIEDLSIYNIARVSITVHDAPAALLPHERSQAYPYLQPDVSIQQVRIEATYAPFSRLYLYRAALKMFRERPWLGIGPGNFSEELYRRQAQQGESWEGLRVTAPWDPHSTYFGALAELGLLGCAAVVIVFGLAVWQILHAMRSAGAVPYTALLWSLLSGLVGYIVYAIDVDILTTRWFWFTVALGGCAWVLTRATPSLGTGTSCVRTTV